MATNQQTWKQSNQPGTQPTNQTTWQPTNYQPFFILANHPFFARRYQMNQNPLPSSCREKPSKIKTGRNDRLLGQKPVFSVKFFRKCSKKIYFNRKIPKNPGFSKNSTSLTTLLNLFLTASGVWNPPNPHAHILNNILTDF